MYTTKRVQCPHCKQPHEVKVDGARRTVQPGEDPTQWINMVCYPGCSKPFEFTNERGDTHSRPK